MIYFDNAATTLIKPKSVLKEISICLKKYGGNPGRSGHLLSQAAGEKIYEVREKIGELLSYPHPERISFTYNATYALNFAILGLIRERCHILISDLEHNSVLRPVYRLCESLGVEYSIFKSSAPDLKAEIECHLREDTRYIISTLASNVTGRKIPLSTLYSIKEKHKLGLIVDASQLIGHEKIDLGRYHCEALCAPGHKALFGIAGCGFAIFGKDAVAEPLIYGGSGSDSRNPFMPEYLPERLEGGTLATPSIAALGKGIEFVQKLGHESISEKLKLLTELTLDRLNSISSVKIHGANGGTVAFSVAGYHPEELAATLNEEGFCLRAGLHCAPLAHSTLGTKEHGCLRISYCVFNSKNEIDKLYKTIKGIIK